MVNTVGAAASTVDAVARGASVIKLDRNFTWPHGRRVAIVLNVAYEGWSDGKAPGLGPIYDAYSFRVLPLLGRIVARDEASYRYLAESIRMHPGQEALLEMMQAAGLEGCRYHNLSGGIVAVHRGYKY